MAVYLHDIPLSQAKEIFQQALADAGLGGVLAEDEMDVSVELLGRVLSRPVWAKISSPHYHASAMDGFCVRADSTNEATLTHPVELLVGEQAVYVDTGDVIPAGFNAVIQIENTEPLDAGNHTSEDVRNPDKIRIRASVVPWHHVRALGEDMVATELVLPAGHTIRPVDLGALAGSGHVRVHVSRKPKVAVIPTGTELVEVSQEVRPGDIIEYNSLVLAAQVKQWGGNATRHSIVVDDKEQISRVVEEAAKTHDMVLLNAGSSAGSEDFSATVVGELGELLVHGIAVRPGHPVILGMLDGGGGRKVPVIGVPGYPVSAALTGEIFLEPLLAQWLGRQPHSPDMIEAELTRKVTSPAGDDDYQRVVVGKVGDRVLATPLSRGAGVLSSLVKADGIAIFPSGSQGKAAGEKVNVRLYRSRSEVDKTIFVIGSHDLTIDLLAQYISQEGFRITSANVGSLAGLIALRRGESHFSGSHLLDPETGEYNFSYIKKYLPGIKIRVVGMVKRQQGLMVPKRNPKGIHSLEDLVRGDVVYINRQPGAGTRVLLDYQLDKLGIAVENVNGYAQEEYTHLMVAAAIASGRADCGMGIAAAAQSMGLDFVPLYEERYDLIVREEYVESAYFKAVLNILNNENFKEDILALPGYQVDDIGGTLAVLE